MGLVLVLENIGFHTGNSQSLNSVLNQVSSDNLKANFDTANPLLFGENPVEALSNLIGHISYVHFKDFITNKAVDFQIVADRDTTRIQTGINNARMTGITAGGGEVPLMEIIRQLKQSGYNGTVSVEYEGTGDSVEDTEVSLKYLESLIGLK